MQPRVGGPRVRIKTSKEEMGGGIGAEKSKARGGNAEQEIAGVIQLSLSLPLSFSLPFSFSCTFSPGFYQVPLFQWLPARLLEIGHQGSLSSILCFVTMKLACRIVFWD